ncbi:MarR family winged helix-turn-helix transcriptional regulator [Nocardia shimofusensis]|uniref:MarR family winged helix-turn-helix transcriptional regulator n=1 Tax=Nocardia shimofusensis TaxID=228596 RepID=UPI000B31B147|nr:MarR family transcriptional regulator [Nocardia shimofusensis]
MGGGPSEDGAVSDDAVSDHASNDAEGRGGRVVGHAAAGTSTGAPTDAVEFETMLLGRHSLAGISRRGGLLDRSAYIVLHRVRMQGPMSVGELSDAFGLDTSTLHRQTTAMMGAGLIERIPDPDGGLARKFRITDEGTARLEEVRARNIRALGRALADWSPEDVAAFADYLRRFNTGLERLDQRPWPRPDVRAGSADDHTESPDAEQPW